MGFFLSFASNIFDYYPYNNNIRKCVGNHIRSPHIGIEK